ncbi:MAG: carbohydrate ABC transporter permease [Deltaproteobacteria bacterium]|nr:carbohydrate ABC transporter permease [Deltaproteobacteria bacterium]MBT4639574.1 carbohydrate ABC transporter permease [Deltaproteobacteria bacterium]MBT6503993.1 carbohydrate ABC transporter permease [Deltaproteobacteria bacterium]MBT7153294.1 carbohydrate ABC transporter permease [Deltaproteobacteria bacterium]MBT7711382.1 carbohydrate ABC transporter permease [Deltaproteobacteria bacterium]
MRQYSKTNVTVYYTVLLTLCLMSLGPIILMLLTSLKLKIDIFHDVSTFIFVPTLKNYASVITDPSLMRYLGNSLIVGLVSTGLTLVMGCMAAYALVRFRFMGKDVVSLTTLLMRMVPPAVLTVPVFAIWTFQYGLGNTLSGLILVYVGINLPFVIWILQSFIVQVPIQLEEAARVDGANPFQIFFLVVLPVIKPGLAAAAIFTFRIAWNEFILALILTNRATRTTPVNISLFMTEHNIDWGRLMAMGMLIAIPPIIFTFVASKQIITGMTAGAVKG